jgi:cryptochrome
MPGTAAPRVLYWFRTDLRITDSPALSKALSLLPSTFVPVWCWDPTYIYGHRVGLNRWNFLLESMTDLSSALTVLNPKQKLHVVRGRPEQILPILVRQWGITHVVWEKDSNAYAKIRDQAVREVLGDKVKIVDVPGRHLFDPDEVIKKNKGKPTMTLNQWQKVS